VIFEPARISLMPVDIPNARAKGFQQTPIVQRIVAKGPLGELSFPIHQGLKWEIKPGQVECEQQLSLEIDKKVFEKLSKYDQKFVRSMWGTTASGLNRIVEGVSEVEGRLYHPMLYVF
jgi:ribosomal protein L6P/L9E